MGCGGSKPAPGAPAADAASAPSSPSAGTGSAAKELVAPAAPAVAVEPDVDVHADAAAPAKPKEGLIKRLSKAIAKPVVVDESAPDFHGTKNIPFIGAALDFAKSPFTFLEKGFKQMDSNVFEFEVGPMKFIALRGAGCVYNFLNSDSISRAHPPPQALELLGCGTNMVVTYMDGKHHDVRKQVLWQVINTKNLDTMLPTIEKTVTYHLREWCRISDFKVHREAREMNVQIMFKVLAGLDPNYVDAYRSYLLKLFRELTEGFGTSVLPVDIPILTYGKALNARDALLSLYKKSLKQHAEAPPEASNSVAAFLAHAAQTAPKDHPFDVDSQAKELHHMIFGSSGTFTLCAHALYQMHQNPEIKQKCFEESKLLPKDHPVTCEDLDKLKYSSATVRELMRIIPMVPFIAAHTVKEWEVEGYKVDKGRIVLVSINQTNRDAAAFADPEEFRPERFFVEEDGNYAALKTHPHPKCAYIPHGGGDPSGHRCLGERLIHYWMQIFVLRVSECAWELVPGQNLEMNWAKFNPAHFSGILVQNFRPIDSLIESEAMKALMRQDEIGDVESLPQNQRGDIVNKREEERSLEMRMFEFTDEGYSKDALTVDKRYGTNIPHTTLSLSLPPVLKNPHGLSAQFRMSEAELATLLRAGTNVEISVLVSHFASFAESLHHSFHSALHSVAVTLNLAHEKPRPSTFAEALLHRFSHDAGYAMFHRTRPDISSWIDDDAEFARQRLGGPNPTVIERVKTLPDISGLPENVRSDVEKQFAAKTLYMCDYSILNSVHYTIEGRKVCAPLVLFGIQELSLVIASSGENMSTKQLMPLAIQLKQPDGCWFTPSGNADLWMAAKLWAASADGHHHSFVSHWADVHMVMEPVMIALHRHMHHSHPLAILMAPHLKCTLAVNQLARQIFSSPGGAADSVTCCGRIGGYQLMSEAYQRFSCTDSLDDDLKRRGVTKEEFPVVYPFRDDAVVLDGVMRTFVRNIVSIYYSSDGDVLRDNELQDWAAELSEHTHEKFIPKQLKTVGEVVEVFSNLLFRVTAFHNAVCSSYFDFYGFVPNFPLVLHGEPPQSNEPIPLPSLTECLPSLSEAFGQIGFAHMLSTPSSDTLLRTHPTASYLFRRIEGVRAVKRFANQLEVAHDEIKQNKSRRISSFASWHPDALSIPASVVYPYLNPRVVHNTLKL
eukprot:TRINITY_DN860_c0_g1_i1.p1 TRINITY_DN860_c0_g1~~TRINITY_DN860_c0_g1_i1.p1  ORF type:complete len:1177 (-),score=278.26 TRINITY_DN860_c0_g1_i1:38-3568(-)